MKKNYHYYCDQTNWNFSDWTNLKKKMFLLNLWNPDQVKKMARVFQVANWSLKKAILLLINNLDAGHDVRTVLNWYMKENWSDHKD